MIPFRDLKLPYPELGYYPSVRPPTFTTPKRSAIYPSLPGETHGKSYRHA